MKKLLLLLIFINSFTFTHAQISLGGGLSYTITGTNTVSVAADLNNMPTGAITIPSSIVYNSATYSVTSIGDYAFNGSAITSVTIPSTVTSIGKSAFSQCRSLVLITIPSSVTAIGVAAFTTCTSLNSIAIPASVTSIGDYVFRYCSSLKSITIPVSVTSIGTYAFSDCIGLTSITISSTVTSIGDYTFNNCNSLTSITIPSSVNSIADYAFNGFTGSIFVDDLNTNYSSVDGVLYNKVQSKLIHCPVIKSGSYTIPSTVTTILAYAFSNCINLTTIIIPSTVTSIGSYAFSNCSGLTSVTISSKVTSIGTYAFSDCTGLTSIYIKAYHPPLNGSGVFSNNITNRCVLFVPKGSKSSYQSATQWKDFNDIREYDYNPEIITNNPISITTSSANIGGNIVYAGISPITEGGIYWGSLINVREHKISNGTGIGSFSSSILGLSPGTTYQVMAFVSNANGITYGDIKTFKTLGSELDLTYTYLTNPGFDINCNYRYNTTSTNLATSNGIASDQAVTGWSTTGSGWTAASSFECGYPGTLNGSAIPTLASDGKTSGSGVGVLGICGGWLGQVIYYQNVSLPAGVYKISYNAYNSSSPTYALSKVGWQTATDSTLSKISTFPQGVWTSDTVTFTLNSATNGKIQVGMQSQNSGSSGNARIFFDYIKLVKLGDQTLPVVTTTNVSAIVAKAAISGGIILSDGGASVTARGVCWSTSANPTVANSKTSEGTGVGVYTSNITGLLSNTIYHMRAYATNSIGTAYGSDLTFTTLNNTALNDNSVELFNVYPNPTNGTFTLNMESISENNSTVCLLNTLGQKVYELKLGSNKSTLNLSDYNFKGIYFLQLLNEKGILLGERKIIFK